MVEFFLWITIWIPQELKVEVRLDERTFGDRRECEAAAADFRAYYNHSLPDQIEPPIRLETLTVITTCSTAYMTEMTVPGAALVAARKRREALK
jgi:hypothetical protein